MNLKKIKDSHDISIDDLLEQYNSAKHDWENADVDSEDVDEIESRMEGLKNRLQTEGYDVDQLERD